MAVISAFSKCLIPPSDIIVDPPAANRNWNPGNYMESDKTGTSRDNEWSGSGGILSRLTADSAGKWKGVMLRFSWTELEGNTLGDYTAGMNKIQSYLNQISAYPGRRLMIFLTIKTFGATTNSVPLYMRNSATYADGKDYYTTRNGVRYQGSFNGQYAYESAIGGPGGYVPNMHVAAVRLRYAALMQEIATRFNDSPYLEGVVMSEAAISQPIGSIGAASQTVNGVVITRPNTDGASWASENAWYNQMALGLEAAKASLTNVQLCQWVNSPRSIMKTWIPTIRAMGVGLGMTDACRLDVGFNFRNDIPGQENTPPGNIQHCQESAGTAMIMTHCSRPAMNGLASGRNQEQQTIQGQPQVYPTYPGAMQSRQAVFDFCKDTVGSTHVVWIHDKSAQPSTGERDPLAPATADAYTQFGNYGGRSYNAVTDEWINAAGSDITPVTTRPTGW